MVGTVAVVATFFFDIGRIIAVAYRAGNLFADFGRNRGSRTSIGGRGEVDEMTVVRDDWPDLAVGASVFIRSFCVVGVAETGVPGIEAGDLVADESIIVPTGSPVD